MQWIYVVRMKVPACIVAGRHLESFFKSSNYYYIWVIPQHSDEIRVKSVCSILILTRLRTEENFSSEEDAGDSTDIQHFFVNLEFCAKILG